MTQSALSSFLNSKADPDGLPSTYQINDYKPDLLKFAVWHESTLYVVEAGDVQQKRFQLTDGKLNEIGEPIDLL
jgi:hypothetical protein